MEKVIMKMENIIKVNGKMVQGMEKEKFIIKMERLNIKGILLIIKLKDMENTFMKMGIIIKVNGKMA